MILSICPNPSIDCTIELDSLNVGKLNRIRNKVETYSGKALNVAIGVARLNAQSLATGFMFEEHKRMFEHRLDKENVKHDFTYCEGSARVNYKVIDNKSMLTEINDIGPLVERQSQIELIEKVKKLSSSCSIAVMSGSLPKGVESEFYGEVVKAIPESVKVIVDAERENVLQSLKSREVYMVKPNLSELEAFSGKSMTDKNSIIEASKRYFGYGVKLVMVSLGSDGAILTDGKIKLYCKSANVAVNSTVGAGDSMVAAASVAIEKGLSLEQVLLTAVAAGTAAITTSGTNLFYKDKHDEILSKIYVEEF